MILYKHSITNSNIYNLSSFTVPSDVTFIVDFNISCIALDWITGNIYIGDSQSQSIGVISRQPTIDTISDLITGMSILLAVWAVSLLLCSLYFGGKLLRIA